MTPSLAAPVSASAAYRALWAFIAVLTAAAGALLYWSGTTEYQGFRERERLLMQAAVGGASREVATLIRELRRSVGVFASDNAAPIGRLAASGDTDSDAYRVLKEKLSTFFPDVFAFTIADASGMPLLEDFDLQVGEFCRLDIQKFVEREQVYLPVIHPSAQAYHFDVMVRWKAPGGSTGVFFVSFRAGILARMLANHGLPGFRLMLLQRDRPRLIEVTERGPRNLLRRDFQLSPGEQARIGASAQVVGTGWDLIALADADLYREELHAIMRKILGVLFVYLVLVLIAEVLIRGEIDRRYQERERFEAEQERTGRQLLESRKLAALGLMAGGVAHEFNNILTAILGYTGLAQERLSAGETTRISGYLGHIGSGGERARDLVRQMLLVVCPNPVAPRPLDLASLLQDSLVPIGDDLPADVRLHADIEADVPEIMGDADQIRQLLAILCRNASDALAGCGEILIRLRRWRHAAGECDLCHARVSGEWVELAVVDAGGGFDPEMKEQLFDPFFTTRNRGEATGLGLAVARSLVEHLGGHMLVESAPGRGSSFRVLLRPVPQSREAGADAPRKPVADKTSLPS